MSAGNIRIRKPHWLKKKLPSGPEYEKVRKLVSTQGLATVCQAAQCPNQFECFSKGTATFMILGEKCTRNCRFCAVDHSPEGSPDPEEPQKVAEAVATMGLRYAVITSVTRDDLEDGGASHFAETIQGIIKENSKTLVEVLIPDLGGDWKDLETILKAQPHVLNHNIETVPRLYKTVRPGAVYERSLELLAKAKEIAPEIPTKSGIMVGLGETERELLATFKDLRDAKVDILTVGQYLQPSRDHLEVEKFLHPDEFQQLEEKALGMGFSGVSSGPSVRSSYESEKLYRAALSPK
jgi:lipoyl synthase